MRFRLSAIVLSILFVFSLFLTGCKKPEMTQDEYKKIMQDAEKRERAGLAKMRGDLKRKKLRRKQRLSELITESKFTYSPENRRDPFISLLGSIEGMGIMVQNLYLAGVMKTGKDYLALIEARDTGYGYILKEGDVLRNLTVLEVSERDVVLEKIEKNRERKQVVLRLAQ